MRTDQKIRLSMYMTIRNFVLLYELIAKKIPRFWEAFAGLQNMITEIQKISEMQGLNKTGLTIGKNKLKNALIALALKYSSIMAIHAKLNSNDALLSEVMFTESELARLAEVTLKDRVQTIYDRIDANLQNLAEQGITPDTQKQFLDTIQSFNNSLSLPRTGIAEKRQATLKLPVLFENADSLIEIMDLAAASAKQEYPDFFNGYKASRKIVDTSSGSLALKATAIEQLSGAPLSGVMFVFTHDASPAPGSNASRKIIKKTTVKGNFNLKYLDSGMYKVEISKDGYKEKQVSIYIKDRERYDLIVELERA